MTRLWWTLEESVSLTGAEDDWRRWLGTEFGPLRRFFMPTNRIVSSRFVDCDRVRWSVMESDGRYLARNNDTYEIRELEKSQVVSVRFNVGLLAKEIATLLPISGGVECVGSSQHVVCVGELSSQFQARGVYICTHKWSRDIIAAVDVIARHASRPFLLLHPTARNIDSQVRTWLQRVDGCFTPIGSLIQLNPEGAFSAVNRRDRLLADCLGIQTGEVTVCRFARDDDFWWVSFDGKPRPVKDSSGMPYIAYLLARPHSDFKAIHLESLVSGVHEVAKTGSRGEQTDRQTLKNLNDRLIEITNELQVSNEGQDFAAVKQLEQERAQILDYVRKVTGLSGEIRDDSDAKRAGDSVSKAIRRAINEIRKKDPGCADHLQSCLNMGIDCRYSPSHPIDWEF